jgi:hypothetical protein
VSPPPSPLVSQAPRPGSPPGGDDLLLSSHLGVPTNLLRIGGECDESMVWPSALLEHPREGVNQLSLKINIFHSLFKVFPLCYFAVQALMTYKEVP